MADTGHERQSHLDRPLTPSRRKPSGLPFLLTRCSRGSISTERTLPPFGTPLTMTVRLVAGIQNWLFWRVGAGRVLRAAVPLRD